MQSRYQQLQPEDRMTIASMSQQGCSMRAMARMLHRAPSTISREIERNALVDLDYGSHIAQQSCLARRHTGRPAPKLGFDSLAWRRAQAVAQISWPG
jgi:IS30 family transposase